MRQSIHGYLMSFINCSYPKFTLTDIVNWIIWVDHFLAWRMEWCYPETSAFIFCRYKFSQVFISHNDNNTRHWFPQRGWNHIQLLSIHDHSPGNKWGVIWHRQFYGHFKSFKSFISMQLLALQRTISSNTLILRDYSGLSMYILNISS